ncbi:MAG: TonB-dependent receptor plug domain-containing protein, partial [Cyclobacteriaceae bacterium]
VSSVFDIGVRDGNKRKLTLTGGISPITGRVTVEGPIKKDTSSFLIGIRSTYSDYILRLLDDPVFRNSTASFSDVVGKVTHQADPKNTFSASFYHSRDKFRLNSDTLYRYFNTGASLQWRHSFNNEFFGHFSSSFTQYNYKIKSDQNPELAFDLDYQINQGSLNADFDLFLNSYHSLKFGTSVTAYQLEPGTIAPGNNSNIKAVNIEQERGLEGALYVGYEFTVSSKFTVYGGLRLSGFGRFGPQEVYAYDPAFSKEITSITDTVNYEGGDLIKAYGGLEYRFSLRYLLSPNLSLKFSVDNTRQNIHLLTNTTSIAPTDVWRLSNQHIKPQIGLQFAAGIYRTFYENGLEISVEGYYKNIDNLLEYKSGADLIVNEVLETDIINAKGRSYGVELLIRKKSGKFTGWMAYTYSRSEVLAASRFPEEQVNSGEYFPSNFDQPHNVSLISNYKANRRINFSLNATYHTGRPTTLPFAQYELNGNVIPFFTERNQFRIPYYLRFDLALNLEGNHRVDKLAHGSWSLSVYNLLGRNNAFSVFSEGGSGGVKVYQLSIFSQPIPTISYRFKF